MPANPYATQLAARLKSDLRHDIPRSMLGSVHLTEAIAAGLGYSSHAALLTAARPGVDARVAAPELVGFTERAMQRLRELRPDLAIPMVEDAFLVAAKVVEEERHVRSVVRGEASQPVKTLEDLQARGALSGEMVGFLRSAIRDHRHILLSGHSGSYVGTLTTALVHAVPASERIVLSHEGPDLFALGSRRVLRAKSYDISREWVLLSGLAQSQGRDAMRACAKAMGAIFRAPGFLPHTLDDLVPALKAWHEEAAPPAFDLIISLSRPRRMDPSTWIQSVWSIEQDWSRTLVAENGQPLPGAVPGVRP